MYEEKKEGCIKRKRKREEYKEKIREENVGKERILEK